MVLRAIARLASLALVVSIAAPAAADDAEDFIWASNMATVIGSADACGSCRTPWPPCLLPRGRHSAVYSMKSPREKASPHECWGKPINTTGAGCHPTAWRALP